jgi:hypothetical protein
LKRKEIAKMKKRETGRKTILLLSIALFIALSITASSGVKAQVECLGACEEQFESCLRNGGSEFAPTCQDKYEACVDACLGGSAATLG